MATIEDGEHEEPWFDDGNLILQADGNVCFKVHRGVLARQSEIFRDMLALPQPVASGEGEPVETVRMYDLPVELSNLLKAIYDGVTFYTRDIEDFFFLTSILRLSTKYFIAHLRRQAIEALVRTWSFALEGHDAMVERALQLQGSLSPQSNALTYPYVHPLHVINLARETNIRVILPSALYFLSVYPVADILQGTHPKLQVESRSGIPRPASTLSFEDMANYTLMYQHRIEVILDFVRKFCGDRRSYPACLWKRGHLDIPIETDRPPDAESPDPCSHAFAKLASRASRSWYPRTGPFRWMLQTVNQLEHKDMRFCKVCKDSFRTDVEKHRNAIWDVLPGVVGLPSWSELIAADLPDLFKETQGVQGLGRQTS
ncbi:hypothetical protein ACEPAI_9119 [Sanghuangporus weigelae]